MEYIMAEAHMSGAPYIYSVAKKIWSSIHPRNLGSHVTIYPSDQTVCPSNLVPRAFPSKNGWGGKRPWHRLVTCTA